MTQRGEQSGDSGKAVNREDFIQISLVTKVLLFVFLGVWILLNWVPENFSPIFLSSYLSFMQGTFSLPIMPHVLHGHFETSVGDPPWKVGSSFQLAADRFARSIRDRFSLKGISSTKMTCSAMSEWREICREIVLLYFVWYTRVQNSYIHTTVLGYLLVNGWGYR